MAESEVLDLITLTEVRDVAVELVRAPGGNPPGGEEPTVTALTRICQARDLAVEATEVAVGRRNLSAVLPGGDGPGLLLLGHTDVVPVGEGWTVDPFGGIVRDHRLFGRGAADMKGGLAACVVAMAALRRAGASLAGPIELAALVDEEENGAGIRAYLDERRNFRGCIVAEPTDLQPIIAARGDSYIEITVRGRAAHSGNPADGINAIYGATTIVAELQRWQAELATDAHPLAGPATWSVGQIHGGAATSTVAAECVINADRRLLPGEPAADVLDGVRKRIDALGLADRGLSVSVEMPMDMPGFETAPTDPLVVAANHAVRDAGGPGLPLGGWTAACDGGFLAQKAGLPVVVLGPGSVNTQAHRPDESVSLRDLVIAARTYALCALRLLSDSARR